MGVDMLTNGVLCLDGGRGPTHTLGVPVSRRRAPLLCHFGTSVSVDDECPGLQDLLHEDTRLGVKGVDLVPLRTVLDHSRLDLLDPTGRVREGPHY